MHARVSPRADYLVRCLDEVSPRALECAEELRVNTLIGRLGFDVATLSDGTEKLGARRLAESGQWGEALCFLMAVLGTGAERDFFNGIRHGAPRGCRPCEISANERWRSSPWTRAFSERLISTRAVCRVGTPVRHWCSRDFSRQSAAARVPTSADELRAFRRSLEVGGRRPPTGVFASLVMDET